MSSPRPRPRPRAWPPLLAMALAWGCQADGEGPPSAGEIADPGPGAILVASAPARLGRLERTVTATGLTAAWREANLRAEVGGRVIALEVDNGDDVTAGTVLLRVDASRQQLAVSGASARVDALAQDVELARSDYERKQGLVAKGSLPAAQLDAASHNLERAEAALEAASADLGSARRAGRDARVSAPIDGIVSRRLVDLGDTIGPGAPLLDLVDLSQVRVRIGLAGSEIGRLDPQADARVVIEDLGGEPIVGRFAALAPSADPMTGLFEVEYHVDNPERRIRGGMVATVELPLRRADERVLIPRAALTRRNGKLTVFVLEAVTPETDAPTESGALRVVRQREVRAGAYGDEEVEIVGGLEAGERVATSAQHALADGVLVELEAAPEPEPEPEPEPPPVAAPESEAEPAPDPASDPLPRPSP